MTHTRKCCLCSQEKPLEVFERNPKKPYGRGYRCHECCRKKKRIGAVETSCKVCCKTFLGRRTKKFCSDECSRSWDTVRVSRSKKRFFQSMLNPKRVSDGLTAEQLLEVYESQEGLCALTGRELTFHRGKGPVSTNVSIDRIDAGKSYNKENIQLVCSAVNSFRRDLTIEEFVDWCEAVVKKSKGGKN